MQRRTFVVVPEMDNDEEGYFQIEGTNIVFISPKLLRQLIGK